MEEQKLRSELKSTQNLITKVHNLINKNDYIPVPFEKLKMKKLTNQEYQTIFQYMSQTTEGQKLLLKSHKKDINSLEDLAGVIYFLRVTVNSKRPPEVGFRFRSYSDSHYTSEDRDNPIACKVREFPTNNKKEIFRLYHFYKGKKFKKRKLKNEDMKNEIF